MGQIAKLFKEHKIGKAIFEFSCGGDSMNETQLKFEDANGAEMELPNIQAEVEGYFDSVIYDKVEFYVNSDGHYEGEFGNVYITLDDPDADLDEVEDEDVFSYEKDSTSEYNESFTEENIEFPLTAVHKKFIEDNISNINGGDWGDITVNFKRDFIMTDAQDTMFSKLKDKIRDFFRDRQPGCEYEGELNESGPSFTTNDEEHQLTIKNNRLLFQASYRSTVYKKDGVEE